MPAVHRPAIVFVASVVVFASIAPPASAGPRARREVRRPEPRREMRPAPRAPVRTDSFAREPIHRGPIPRETPAPPLRRDVPPPTTGRSTHSVAQRAPSTVTPASPPVAPSVVVPLAPSTSVAPPTWSGGPVYIPPPAVGLGTSLGSSGIRVAGSSMQSGAQIMDSVVNGAVLGSAGGPIGAAVGAGVGLLHGLWSTHRAGQVARGEAARQRDADRKIEEQLAAQRPGASADEQGVRIVKDHLADTPNESPPTDTAVASVPPAAGAPTPPREQVDPDGFRPVHEGGRLVRRERVAANGKVTEALHYDAQEQLVRRDESSRLDGRFDTSTFYADGKPQRRESDTDGDGAVDLWATYDAVGEVARLETVGAGRRHTQVYVAGKVTEEEWRRVSDGVVTARVKYQDGKVREKLDGNLLRYFEANGDVAREEELGADGRATAVAFYERGRIVRRELYEIDEKAFERVPLVKAETPASVTR